MFTQIGSAIIGNLPDKTTNYHLTLTPNNVKIEGSDNFTQEWDIVYEWVFLGPPENLNKIQVAELMMEIVRWDKTFYERKGDSDERSFEKWLHEKKIMSSKILIIKEKS